MFNQKHCFLFYNTITKQTPKYVLTSDLSNINARIVLGKRYTQHALTFISIYFQMEVFCFGQWAENKEKERIKLIKSARNRIHLHTNYVITYNMNLVQLFVSSIPDLDLRSFTSPLVGQIITTSSRWTLLVRKSFRFRTNFNYLYT
jgi:hypothetical protein